MILIIKIKGKYKISKEEAEEECGYKFTYNNEGKLVFVDYIGKLNILIPLFFVQIRLK